MVSEAVAHIYNGVLLSHKKEWIEFESVELRLLKLEPVVISEVSFSEREKQMLYINTSI